MSCWRANQTAWVRYQKHHTLAQLIQRPRVLEILVLLWHFRFMTTAQLNGFLGGRADQPLALLVQLGIVHQRRHGSRTVNQLCGEDGLAHLGERLQPAIQREWTGGREPGKPPAGHVRHSLLAVEEAMHLLASRNDLRLRGLGGKVDSWRTLRGSGPSGSHALGRRVPYADVKITTRQGKLVFADVISAARDYEIEAKLLRWIETLDGSTNCDEVVFVVATPRGERKKARELLTDTRDRLLERRPYGIREFTLWDGALKQTLRRSDAWNAWRRSRA